MGIEVNKGGILDTSGGGTSLRGFPLAKASAPAKPGLRGLWLTPSRNALF